MIFKKNEIKSAKQTPHHLYTYVPPLPEILVPPVSRDPDAVIEAETRGISRSFPLPLIYMYSINSFSYYGALRQFGRVVHSIISNEQTQ